MGDVAATCGAVTARARPRSSTARTSPRRRRRPPWTTWPAGPASDGRGPRRL